MLHHSQLTCCSTWNAVAPGPEISKKSSAIWHSSLEAQRIEVSSIFDNVDLSSYIPLSPR